MCSSDLPLQPPRADRRGRRERLHLACQAAGRVTIRDRHAPCRQLTPLPSRRLQLQQQVAQLGALAREACLGPLAHPPTLADFLGARTHAVVPVHRLLEQLGGYARIGQRCGRGPSTRRTRCQTTPPRRPARRARGCPRP